MSYITEEYKEESVGETVKMIIAGTGCNPEYEMALKVIVGNLVDEVAENVGEQALEDAHENREPMLNEGVE